MKKIILSLIIIHCLLHISYSQDVWVVQPSGTNSQLNMVYSRFSGSGYVVGNNGTIIYTINGGSNWINQPSGTTNNLYGFGICGLFGYIAVGANGTILRTTNEGNNWYPLNSGVNITLRSTYALGFRTIVIGDNGTILRSSNNGANWSVISSPSTSNLKCITQLGTWVYAVGSGGTILRSTNLGTIWTMIPSGTNNGLNKIIFSSNGYGWIAGDNGLILKSIDEGNSWTSINSGTSVNLLSIDVPDSAYGWACGLNGKILYTKNGGINWFDDFFGSINTMNDVTFPNENFGWVVGSNGLILHTEFGPISYRALLLDANTISTWYTNWGNFNRDPVSSNAGFEWPKGTHMTARYTSGPWLGAIVDNDTLIAMAEFSYEYFPGYTDISGIPHGRYDTLYKVYKLTYGVTNKYRWQWPNALLGNSDQGAPIYFDNNYNTWKPLDCGDQTMYYSYTDSYPESHVNRAGSTNPLKADIKQTNFAFNQPGALGNIQYCQFMIVNRSNATWNDTYITLWTDDDLGSATDDKVGSDTLLELGYTYNGSPTDPVYGIPPAVGFVLIKGPAVYTGTNTDTAFTCCGKTKKFKVGYKQQHMSVLNWYASGDPVIGDPRIYYETYRYMEGLNRDGDVYINPITGHPTKFVFSGDPVTGTGWIQSTMADYRFLLSTGPLTMNPGDTQYVVIAQVIAQGTSYLNSISVLRQYAQTAKDYYSNCFYNLPIGIENTQNQIPTKFSLQQNYPNPFNPVTKIRFSVPLNKGGLRGLSLRIVVYDLLGREVATLIPPLRGGQEGLKPGWYEVEWDGSNYASGVYFYKLEAGDASAPLSITKKMVLIK